MQIILFYLLDVDVLKLYGRYLYSYVYENHEHVNDDVFLVGMFFSIRTPPITTLKFYSFIYILMKSTQYLITITII
ncbi:hypothetical protein GCM10019815_12100 [Pediococcus damnosus]